MSDQAKILNFVPEGAVPTGKMVVTVQAGMPYLNVRVEMEEASYYSLWESGDGDGMSRVRTIAAFLLDAGANKQIPLTITGLRETHRRRTKLQREIYPDDPNGA
jgi:hypothetical protein